MRNSNFFGDIFMIF